MEAVSQDFKNAIKQNGREISISINYRENNVWKELKDDVINSVSLHYEGNILKSVMRQLDIVSKEDIEIGKEVIVYFSVKVSNLYDDELYDANYEDEVIGRFIVYSSEKQEDDDTYSIVCYDKMLYAMKDYEKLDITYPITVQNYFNAICNYLNIGSTGISVNADKMILNEPYLLYNSETQEWESLGYTFRDVLDEIAEVTASTICISREGVVECKYIRDVYEIIDENSLKDINVNFGEMTKPINTITFKRSADSDVISKSYPENLPDNEKNEIVIRDNQILNFNNRDEFLDDILNELLGLTYSINDFSSKGITYLDICDKYDISITKTDNEGNTTTTIYPCIMLNDEINITQGLEENIHTDLPEQSTTDYTKSDTTDRRINQTYLIVDKQNQTIESVVSQTTTQNDKISRLTQKVDQLESEISDVADLTISGESSYASVDLDNINESNPVTLKVRPIVSNIAYLHPRNNLYPSSTTYLTNRKVRFHNDTTNEDIDYELPEDLLYYDDTHYDEFVLDYNNQTCQVNKKCKYNADGSVALLDNETINTYTYPTINLTDGDYTISLLGYSNAYLFVRLMSQNIYTSQFYTKIETNSIINQTSQSIDLSVNTKLSNYSTTNEMNSAINLKANEITSSVNNTLTNYSTTTQMNSAITQKANEITSEVSETYETIEDAENTYATKTTTNNLSSRISQTAKNISLQVNNGSTSSGITIGVTKEDGTTEQATGTITMNGLVKFTDLSTSGATTINGANIQTGTLSASKITSGTLSANRISGGTIDASSINLGSGKFSVNTSGSLNATRGVIAGWSLTTDRLYGTWSGDQYSIRPYGVSNDTTGISQSWSRIMSSASDENLKNNINILDDKYEDFYNDLKPVSFYYNKGIIDNKKHFGFVAQDILANEKEKNEDLSMVEKSSESKYYNVYKEEIIALNTWQIQKLKEEVKLLKEEVEILKGIIKNGNM